MRVFVQDYNTELTAYRAATNTKSNIITNMKWQLRKAFSKDIVIPFDSQATLCSTDLGGMYFDCFMEDLDVNEVYEIEFIISENNNDYFITDSGFRFKVSR